jgi:hypothetical protein
LRLGKSDFFTNSLGAPSQVQLFFHNHSTTVSARAKWRTWNSMP